MPPFLGWGVIEYQYINTSTSRSKSSYIDANINTNVNVDIIENKYYYIFSSVPSSLQCLLSLAGGSLDTTALKSGSTTKLFIFNSSFSASQFIICCKFINLLSFYTYLIYHFLLVDLSFAVNLSIYCQLLSAVGLSGKERVMPACLTRCFKLCLNEIQDLN